MIWSIQCFSSHTEPCDHEGFGICGLSFRLMCIFPVFVLGPCLSCSLPPFPPYLGQSATKILITHPALSEKGYFLPCLVEITAAGPTAGSPGI